MRELVLNCDVYPDDKLTIAIYEEVISIETEYFNGKDAIDEAGIVFELEKAIKLRDELTKCIEQLEKL